MQIGGDQRCGEPERQRECERRKRAEKRQRPLVTQQPDDQAQDAPAIAPGSEFARRPRRPRPIRALDMGDRERQLQGVNRQFRLDVEPGGQHRKRLHEPAGQHLVSRQHVLDTVAENHPHRPREQKIAEAVPVPVSGIVRLAAYAVHQIERTCPGAVDHRRCQRRIIGIVAIRHHIEIGLDVTEHAADDVAFALQRLVPHHRTGLPGDRRRIVGRVVVKNVDRGLGQRAPKRMNHVGNRNFLVEAGKQNGNAWFVSLHRNFSSGVRNGPYHSVQNDANDRNNAKNTMKQTILGNCCDSKIPPGAASFRFCHHGSVMTPRCWAILRAASCQVCQVIRVGSGMHPL